LKNHATTAHILKIFKIANEGIVNFLDITLNQKKNNATILPYSNNIQKLGSSFRVSAQSIEVS
jgi:hypothetical protein